MPLLVGVGVVVLITAAVVYFLGSLLEDDPQQKKVVQQITLITPPPPPPPPPEPEVEPEIEEEEIIEEMDEPMPDQVNDAPVGESLGLDADGAAGGDSFGLVGRKGGRGILGGGYAGKLQQMITQLVLDDEQLKHLNYVVILKLWVSESGKLSQYEVVQQSGDAQVRDFLELALARLDNFDTPPLEMPQPIKLRIKSRI